MPDNKKINSYKPKSKLGLDEKTMKANKLALGGQLDTFTFGGSLGASTLSQSFANNTVTPSSSIINSGQGINSGSGNRELLNKALDTGSQAVKGAGNVKKGDFFKKAGAVVGGAGLGITAAGVLAATGVGAPLAIPIGAAASGIGGLAGGVVGSGADKLMAMGKEKMQDYKSDNPSGLPNMFSHGGKMNMSYNNGGQLSYIPDNSGTHEQNPYGGVELGNSNNFVEGGEYVMLDKGNKMYKGDSSKIMSLGGDSNSIEGRVLSKRLGYADKMKSFMNKINKVDRGDNESVNETAKNQFFNNQFEAQKIENSIDKEIHSMGGTIFSKGGKIHIKPSKVGTLHTALGVAQGEKIPVSKLTIHESDSPALRKKKQFAINARKWHHENGGNLFLNGGATVPTEKEATINSENPYVINNLEDIKANENRLNSLRSYQSMYESENENKLNSLRSYRSKYESGAPFAGINNPYLKTQLSKNLATGIQTVPKSLVPDSIERPLPFDRKMSVLGAGLQSLDPLFNLGLGASNKEYVSYKSPVSKRIDPYRANALVRSSMIDENAGTRNAILNTLNTPGQQIGNLAVTGSRAAKDIGTSLAGNLFAYDQSNIGTINKDALLASEIYNKNLDAREQIADARKTAFSSGLRSIGNIGAGITKTKQEYSQDNLKNNTIFNMAKKLYPNFHLMSVKDKNDILAAMEVKFNQTEGK